MGNNYWANVKKKKKNYIGILFTLDRLCLFIEFRFFRDYSLEEGKKRSSFNYQGFRCGVIFFSRAHRK